MASKRNAAKILRGAAKLVELGWTQGTYYKDGSFCAVGAINKAAGHGAWMCDGDDNCLARWALGKVVGSSYVPEWNDAIGRTSVEVASAMRKTARLLEHGLSV